MLNVFHEFTHRTAGPKNQDMAEKSQSNRLLVFMLVGIAVGILLGGFSPAAGDAVAFVGDLFIKALLTLVVPLIIASMIVGINHIGDIRRLPGVGGKTLAYYMLTTAASVILGIVLVLIISPGGADTERERIELRGGQLMEREGYIISDRSLTLVDSGFARSFDDRYMIVLLDQGKARGIVAKVHGPNSSVITVKDWTDPNGEPKTPRPLGVGLRVDLTVTEIVKAKKSSMGEVLREVVTSLVPRNLFKAMANNDVLPLIVFSLVFGAVLMTLGERGRPVLRLFEGLNEAIMKIILLLMLAAPVGVGALIAGRLARAGGFAGFGPELLRLGKYSLTVMVGLLIHAFITLPLILRFFGKRRVGTYSKNIAPALTTAFSTASSAATLPLTIQCTNERNRVPLHITNFVLPLGATINMDGTALYEAVAAIFIAQVYGIELGLGHLIIIFLTATLAAVGAAAIPQAGLVTMIIVLRAVNLPIEGISLILVIDWFLDRCRTTVNVWGDAVGCAVIERYEAGSEKR